MKKGSLTDQVENTFRYSKRHRNDDNNNTKKGKEGREKKRMKDVGSGMKIAVSRTPSFHPLSLILALYLLTELGGPHLMTPAVVSCSKHVIPKTRRHPKVNVRNSVMDFVMDSEF